jgi:hypothetical protein
LAYHSYSGDAYKDLQTLGSLTNVHGIDLPVYLTETVTTPDMLRKLASAGVKCVIHNAQIESEDDYDASTGKGLLWARTFREMTS